MILTVLGDSSVMSGVKTDSKTGLIWTVDNGKSLGFEGQLGTLRRILNINHLTTGFDGYQICSAEGGRCGFPLDLSKKPKDAGLQFGSSIYIKQLRPPPSPPHSPVVDSSSYSSRTSRHSLSHDPSKQSNTFSNDRLRQLNNYATKLNKFSDEDLKVIFGDKPVKGSCPTCGVGKTGQRSTASYGDIREVSTAYEPTEKSVKSYSKRHGKSGGDRADEKSRSSYSKKKAKSRHPSRRRIHWVNEWDKLTEKLQTDNLLQHLPNSALGRAWTVHDDDAALYDPLSELHDILSAAPQEESREYLYDYTI
eukprot:TRINITY_DN7583_c0_g1_i1.p1 TRINITY_DN7583_c0_g1~~TRINITY_DN7583_c0_g1_i1.p1  ORF type:complete len:307 (+),score=43.31 TRINITY_DN7583_c0_g1_i1:70-990(+)